VRAKKDWGRRWEDVVAMGVAWAGKGGDYGERTGYAAIA